MRSILALTLLVFISSACSTLPELNQKLETVRTLSLQDKDFVSAGSGLVLIDDTAYVVADDERYLYSFDLKDSKTWSKLALTKTDYPADGKERSQAKADYEALMPLEFSGQKYLLVLPSGSGEKRNTAALVHLTKKTVQPVDLAPLYKHIQKSVKRVNIEGLVETPSEIILFHRGNGHGGENAMIHLNKSVFLVDLKSSKITAQSVVEVQKMEIGFSGETALTFSDAKYVAGVGIYFLASAEAGSGPQSNGEVLGTMLGFLSEDTKKPMQSLGWFAKEKFEGLEVRMEDGKRYFYLVDDPDDRNVVARLLKFNM